MDAGPNLNLTINSDRVPITWALVRIIAQGSTVALILHPLYFSYQYFFVSSCGSAAMYGLQYGHATVHDLRLGGLRDQGDVHVCGRVRGGPQPRRDV